MLKVLIADDERKVCQLIEKLIDWDELGMQVVATAENGVDALERIQQYHPDIAVTDIRMPGYDGLELIRQGKEFNPKMEFVIISGYRHFEYAQTAIRYGVSAYILKPIKKDELTETLRKLGGKFREKTEQLSHEEQIKRTLKTDEETLRQTFLSDLVCRRNKERLSCPLEQIRQEFHYSFYPDCFCMAILKMDGHVFDNQDNLQFMADKIKSSMDRLLKECTHEYEMTFIDSFFYFLLNFKDSQRTNIRKQTKALLDEVRIQAGIFKDSSATMALGTVCSTPAGLEPSLKNAQLWIEERLVAGTGKLSEGEFLRRDSFTDTSLFSDFNHRMSQALESLEVFPVREAMMELKTGMLGLPGITGHEIFQMTKEVCNLYLFFMKNYKIRIEEDFLDSFYAGAINCGTAAELFDYLIRRITASYEKAARLKRQDENRPIRIVSSM